MKDLLYKAIETHWRAHRPRMVKSLERSGHLPRALEYAATRTAEAEASLIQQGVPAPQAQERMRQEWAFLPSEADVADLPNGPPQEWLRRARVKVGDPLPVTCDAHDLARIFNKSIDTIYGWHKAGKLRKFELRQRFGSHRWSGRKLQLFFDDDASVVRKKSA